MVVFLKSTNFYLAIYGLWSTKLYEYVYRGMCLGILYLYEVADSANIRTLCLWICHNI